MKTKDSTKTVTTGFNKLTDAEIITLLRAGNQKVTAWYFKQHCCAMLERIRARVFNYRIETEELMNELYIFLSRDDWHKLVIFKGTNGCTLDSWVEKISRNHFMTLKKRLGAGDNDELDNLPLATLGERSSDMAMDISDTLRRMRTRRYVQVIKWMFIEGYDADEVAEFLHTNKANVYNIKRRAIAQFIAAYGSLCA